MRFLIVLLITGFGGSVGAATQTLFLNNESTERVIVDPDPQLNPSAGITIELWVRPTSLDCDTFVGKGFDTGYWFGSCGSGRLRYYPNGPAGFVDGTATLPLGEWSHVAVTYDGSTTRFYINGELDRSVATAFGFPANDRALGFGAEGSSPSFPLSMFPFSGRLSEVRLWSYRRDETQIRHAMYQQITVDEPGLIGVWALEGGVEERFGRFTSTLAPGASFSGLDSPPVPHDPLRVRAVGSISADGFCNDPGYQTSTRIPSWYRDPDIILGEVNPEEIWLGADASYLYVCMPDRNRLNDSIYTVEIDTANGADLTLQPDDYRFRYWPGNDGLSTARGETVGTPPLVSSRWSEQPSNPTGLFAGDSPGVEFVTDMEMRIPRSILPATDSVFGIRVAHNFLIDGGTNDLTVDWPFDTSSTSPASWQAATIDLTSTGPADSLNPRVFSVRLANDEPRFFEDLDAAVDANDDVDIEVLEILIDGAVVESCDFLGSADRNVDCRHMDRYAVGSHTIQARAFDHVGREGRSRLRSFRVLVDGEPPSITLAVTPSDPAPGQSITLTARARDPSGVQWIQLTDMLGLSFPSFNRCDHDGSGGVETCTWSLSYSPAVIRARFTATAQDSEGYRASTVDHVVLFGNSGSDRDDDGLSDRVEAGLCTDPDNPDTDDDGLSDGWETTGIRFADGSVYQLLDHGVNPCWKNVLLQLDYESGAMPPTAGRRNLINQYRANGITAYLEVNQRPRPTAYPQSHIGAPTATYQLDEGEYYFEPKRNWSFFYGYERNLPGRSGAWMRFFTVDHHIGSDGFCSGGDEPGKGCRGDFECPGSGAQCVAGCKGGTNDTMSCTSNTDCPKDDGTFATCSAPCVPFPDGSGAPTCGVINDLAYRLFHEFGHTIGLGHGGWQGSRANSVDGGFVTKDIQWDSRNNKPNHQSAMNYLYNQGEICMEPIPSPIPEGFGPSFVGQITYMERNLGDLNENQLSESSASTFSINLRTRDCAHASATAIPVFKYTCKNSNVQYEVISDGVRTLARRPKDGDWDFSPPAHSPGIDWNCNGAIDIGTVAENVDGPGWYRSDGFWDEAAWNRDDSLRGRQEFASIPNPVTCQMLYRANCAEREKSCYVFPVAYRNAIPALASGVAPLDCRPIFLASRGSINGCGGGSDSDFGTGTCPAVDRDAPVALAIEQGEVNGWDDMAAGTGSADSDQFIEVSDDEEGRLLPGVELCDLNDTDGDGEIDEGCADTDSDGVPDAIDNCIEIANADQADRDSDGLGEACQFPAVDNLLATWDNDRTVSLTWDDNGIPRLGFSVYRYGVDNPDPVYRGGPYPSATGTSFDDSVNFGDNFTYIVRPVNLNGVEGEPLAVSVVVDIDNTIFADSFE